MPDHHLPESSPTLFIVCYRPQTKLREVMFSQASVFPLGWGREIASNVPWDRSHGRMDAPPQVTFASTSEFMKGDANANRMCCITTDTMLKFVASIDIDTNAEKRERYL